MSLNRPDPGVCPICGAAHTTCTASTGPITLVQLPARDVVESVMGAVASATMNLGDGVDGRPVSTKTYRNRKGKR